MSTTPSPTAPILTGPRGRYRLLSEHGRGGFGVTYRGVREDDGREVIVKTLRLDKVPGWKGIELFEREASMLRALDHPNIPDWIDDFPLGDPASPRGFALVMELIPGRTLRDMIRSGGLSAQAQGAWFSDVLGVLSYLHNRAPAIIHRDVNPKNIVLRPDGGEAALVDFGCVQAALRAADENASTSAGTFGYAPLEQFVERATPASDLYALGMTYLASATGCEPSDLPIDGIRVNVRKALPAGDPQLLRLLESMTAPDPRQRLQRADEALSVLARLRGGRAALGPVSSAAPLLPVDADAYLERLAVALGVAGFDVDTSGVAVGATSVAVVARREPDGMTGRPVCVYVVRDDAIEGGARGRPLEPITCALFAQTVIDANARVPGGFWSQLVARDVVVVPIIVASRGLSVRVAGHVRSSLREAQGVLAVVALVDLVEDKIQVVTPSQQTVDEAPDLVAMVRGWL